MGLFDFFKKDKESKEQQESLDKGLEKSKASFFDQLSKAVVGKATVDEFLSDEQRLALVGPYQGAEALAWLAEHPLPTPNVLLRIRPDRVVSRGV